MKSQNGFNFKKRQVLEGTSQIFKNWADHSTITIEEFLEALEWVCDDPMQKFKFKNSYGELKDWAADNAITAEECLEILIQSCNKPMQKANLLNGYAVLKDRVTSFTITTKEFLEELGRICELDDSYVIERMTREIGLTPTGIVRLERVNDIHGNFVGFFCEDGKLWRGADFETPCPEEENPFYGDTVIERHQISISCRDRI